MVYNQGRGKSLDCSKAKKKKKTGPILEELWDILSLQVLFATDPTSRGLLCKCQLGCMSDLHC